MIIILPKTLRSLRSTFGALAVEEIDILFLEFSVNVALDDPVFFETCIDGAEKIEFFFKAYSERVLLDR